MLKVTIVVAAALAMLATVIAPVQARYCNTTCTTIGNQQFCNTNCF